MSEVWRKKKQKHCCISHEFLRAASKSPTKIAVIHTSDGSRIARQLRSNAANSQLKCHDSEPAASPSPSVYDGDRCFTFSDVATAVDSLSRRLRRVLDGGDDPHLIKPRGSFHGERSQDNLISKFLKTPGSSLEQSAQVQDMVSPKILGVYMEPSVEYITTVLSILRSGDAFLPLDPSWPKERILSVVSSSNVDLIVGCRSSCERSSYCRLDRSHWLVECINCPVLCIYMEENLGENFDLSDMLWPCENEKPRSFCYLMYTSGSTGKPKGVCGTEDGLLNRFLWMQEFYPLEGEELLLFKTSISFIDHLQEFLVAVLTTCTLVIPPFNELKENPFYVVDFLQIYSINRLTAVPSLMRAILPALQSSTNVCIQISLKLIVLSGEILPLSLWEALSKMLPNTSILNLYGSTEVSGDCTYFDCKRLPMLLETESLSSVPIGIPIPNCDVALVGENDIPDRGEMYVGGICVSLGYFPDPAAMSLDYVTMHLDSLCSRSIMEHGRQLYFRTGDFARRLQSGDLVFTGRNDRTVKVNGQRIALEEIENILRRHPDVVDAAVISPKGQGELVVLEAFILAKQKNVSGEVLRSSIRVWMVDKVPLAMIPNYFFFIESFPMSSSGKVDYAYLAGLTFSTVHVQDEIRDFQSSDFLEIIKKAFCDALMVQSFSDDDDFFMLGGNSIAAAHASHSLGIDMRLLYIFPSPSKLQMALLQNGPYDVDVGVHSGCKLNVQVNKGSILHSVDNEARDPHSWKSHGGLLRILCEKTNDYSVFSKRLKVDSDVYASLKGVGQRDKNLWNSVSLPPVSCSISKCNKVMCDGEYEVDDVHHDWLVDIPRNRQGVMRTLWKVNLDSCVDASPTIVFKNGDVFLFIGSHAHKFLCVNAKSGSVQWEIKLEGRIECSAAVLGDFSLVVVGCYKGKVYFLDFSNGDLCWTFQTYGEVKSQPVIDTCRHLVWCGSYDHNLYALDYRNYCCVYKLPCGGSIYGSPAIDEVHGALYVASTSGRVTALSIKALQFSILWQHELKVPVFGSLSISSPHGNVICCLVDGQVVALDANGSIIWKGRTGGPIFAGACISYVLPSQALICSRNGSVYSFEVDTGDLLWEYYVGDPITASAYVDENLQLLFVPNHLPDRLVCICACSGSIHLLRIKMHANPDEIKLGKNVEEFAQLNLPGDIFSSPVMIGGRIFVGCRDDFVHCLTIESPA